MEECVLDPGLFEAPKGFREQSLFPSRWSVYGRHLRSLLHLARVVSDHRKLRFGRLSTLNECDTLRERVPAGSVLWILGWSTSSSRGRYGHPEFLQTGIGRHIEVRGRTPGSLRCLLRSRTSAVSSRLLAGGCERGCQPAFDTL
jgi:hypothetical protein